MSLKYAVDKSRTIIKYNGTFDWDKLYNFMHNWFIEHGYELQEKTYKLKKGTVFGREGELGWEAWRKESDYMKFWITLSIDIKSYNEVEVVSEKGKKKLVNAAIWAILQGSIELDYEGRLDTSLFARKLRQFHRSFIMKKELDEVIEPKIHYEVMNLQNGIKNILAMESRETAYR